MDRRRGDHGPCPAPALSGTIVVMRSPDDVPREPGQGLDVVALHAALRRRGFDLRRAAFVSYFLETGPDRDTAFAVLAAAADDGWQPTLFGDDSGWVVRVSRNGPVRRDVLEQDRVRVERLARAHAAHARGVVVEDPDVGDVWAALAHRQRAARPAPPARAAIPAQRRSTTDTAPGLTRSA